MGKIKLLCVAVALLALGSGGCGRSNDDAAIRAAINTRLTGQTNLNMSAFDTNIQKVDIQGDQAQVDVKFQVKNGPAAMELTYNLKKTGGTWAVVDANPRGPGLTNAPADPVANPASDAPGGDLIDAIHQKMDAAPVTEPGAKPALPPGHPQ